MLRREATGAIDFQYGHGWQDWRGTFPVSLSLPLREERYIGAPVVNVFDNLLPDSDVIRNRVAERVGAEGTDVFSLLTALGRDCVGALQFLPDNTAPGAVGDVGGKPVSDDEVAYLIKNLAAAPLGMGEDKNFRISIAGDNRPPSLQGEPLKALDDTFPNPVSYKAPYPMQISHTVLAKSGVAVCLNRLTYGGALL